MSEREEFEKAVDNFERRVLDSDFYSNEHYDADLAQARADLIALYATALRERDEEREILRTLMQEYESAPGLPLEDAPQEALEKWTDALIAIGMLLSRPHRSLSRSGEGA